MNEFDVGDIRKVSDFTVVWDVPRIIDMIREGKHYFVDSEFFEFEWREWRLYLRQHTNYDSGVEMARLSILRYKIDGGLFDDDTGEFATQSYQLYVEDVEGRRYWTSPVTTDDFNENNEFRGTDHDLLESDLRRDASLIAPEGVLSIHLTFYLAGGIDNLGPNLKDLLLSGQKSDVTLVAAGRQFRAHRAILVTRSPVFDDMLKQGRLQQMQITGCGDAEIFQEFLLFLYSGTLEALAVGNVVALSSLADKYDVKGLAAACVDFMLSNLAVDSFCDFLTPALRHCEVREMRPACRFLASNKERIIATKKWKDFAARHPNAASEMLKKGKLYY